ncbi:MAG: retropepsin-like aspartic protease, partial [Spirochaetia bacterium]
PRVSMSVFSNYSTSCIEVPVKRTFSTTTIVTKVLVDSGAAGSFIDENLDCQYEILQIPCKSPLAVAALDGHPLGAGHVQSTTTDIKLQVGILHTEVIRVFTIHSPHNPVVLGLPWLQRHNSHFLVQIMRWVATCLSTCLQPVSPMSVLATAIKAETTSL